MTFTGILASIHNSVWVWTHSSSLITYIMSLLVLSRTSVPILRPGRHGPRPGSARNSSRPTPMFLPLGTLEPNLATTPRPMVPSARQNWTTCCGDALTITKLFFEWSGWTMGPGLGSVQILFDFQFSNESIVEIDVFVFLLSSWMSLCHKAVIQFTSNIEWNLKMGLNWNWPQPEAKIFALTLDVRCLES